MYNNGMSDYCDRVLRVMCYVLTITSFPSTTSADVTHVNQSWDVKIYRVDLDELYEDGVGRCTVETSCKLRV